MRFVCDGTLGKLCKYLRICGFDARWERDGKKAWFAAIREGRVLLTRNRRRPAGKNVYIVGVDDPVEQLRQTLAALKLKRLVRMLTRCTACNRPLRRIKKAAVRNRVPYYTYKTFRKFARCPSCGRIYWHGSHGEDMTRRMSGMRTGPAAGALWACVLAAAVFVDCLPYVNRAGTGGDLIRVAIADGICQVAITGVKNGTAAEYNLTPGDSLPAVFHPGAGPVTVDGRPYRGTVEVKPAGAGLRVINILPIEDYLKGVVPCEIGRIGPDLVEIGKAQAIASRTYAYAHLNRRAETGYDVSATTRDQVYEGVPVENAVANAAVSQTRGMIITYRGEPIDAKYHSTCGGMTAEFGDAWSGTGPPYLTSVRCPYCTPSPHFTWRKVYPKEIFFSNLRQRLAAAGFGLDTLERIVNFVLFKNRRTGRVIRVKFTTDRRTFEITAGRIRSLFGTGNGPDAMLKSNLFEIDAGPDSVAITGRGWGHGVGMCQFGAIEMARRGRKFGQILKHYFPKTKIKKK